MTLITNTVSREFRFPLEVRDGDRSAHSCSNQRRID
jgi:hypothetical protein